MKRIKWLIWIAYPLFFIALFASLLTTRPYMNLSENRYDSHDMINFDYAYVSGKLMDYLNYRSDDLHFGATPEDDEPLLRHDVREVNGETVLISEIEHMKDVREVYTNVRIAGLIGLLITITLSVIFYKQDKRLFYETYRDLFYLPLFFILFVGGWFLINFNHAFTIFHELFFDGNWQFSRTDALIMLLPWQFWLVSGMIILVLLGVAITVPSIIARQKLKSLYGKEA